MQPDELAAVADVVAQAIQDALAPVLERLAVVEASLDHLMGEGPILMALRERVAVVETKAARPEPPVVDITPVLERLAAVDSRLAVLGDLRERVAIVETKAALPPPAPALLAAVEQTDPAVGDLRRQLEALEQTTRQDAIRLEGYTAALQRDEASLRERVAVVETRAPVPGPDGKDGLNGMNGVDGLGWDDLSVVHDGDRTFTLQAARGDQRKDLGTFAVPYMIYRGVFQEGRTYAKGDMVTWAGSLWLVNESTAIRPDDLSKAWTLCVKRGRDGRDGKDAPGALPVVSVGPTPGAGGGR